MSVDQYPILIVIIPMFASLAITLLGWFYEKSAWALSTLSLAATTLVSGKLLNVVIEEGPQHYFLANWKAPFGIEYVVDHLNASVLFMVSLISFLVSLYSKESVKKEIPFKIAHFYTLFVLLVTGLLGITITGDAFNLYVLMEIAALTSYALIALGQKRAYLSAFNYVIMGSIGACFYLLGVGYLFIKTGTLNMLNLQELLPMLNYSQAIFVGFIFILMGLLTKMAFFPLHGWLPNAYTHAPTVTSCLVAPLMTKVSVYVLVRIMFTVFSADYVFNVLSLQNGLVFFSVVSIVAGSLFALTQTDLKKMLTYLIVAEIGYMVGGLWLGNANGLTGAVYHIIADGFMTACLFMAIGCIIYKVGDSSLASMKGAFQKMPLTMIGFAIGAFSMIGIPPTCGFFSKWYLLSGAYEAGQCLFFAALLFSSLVNVVLFFRVFEVGFFQSLPEETPDHPNDYSVSEAPLTMTVPLLITAALLIGIGLYTNEIISELIQHIIPIHLL